MVLFAGGLVGLVVLTLWLYCIFDVIATDEQLMRNMPKPFWLIIVIILPTVGSLAWLILGRPQNAGLTPGDTTYRAGEFRPPRPLRSEHPSALPRGPEDSPGFMADLDERSKRLKQWEEDLRRREEELKRQEGDDPT